VFEYNWATTHSVVKLDTNGNELVRVEGYSARDIAVDPRDGSCWVAALWGGNIVKLDAIGNELVLVGEVGAYGISVNPVDGCCWVACPDGVIKLDADGNELIQIPSFVSVKLVSTNYTENSCWIAGGRSFEHAIAKLDTNGNELVWVGGFSQIVSLSVNPTDGSCWVSQTYPARVVKLDTNGNELVREVGDGWADRICISVNPSDGSCWVATDDNDNVVKLDANGNELVRVEVGVTGHSISVNPTDGSCWVASLWGGNIVKLDANGNELVRVGVEVGDGWIDNVCISVSPTDGSCWAAWGGESSGFVVKLDANGSELFRVGGFGSIQSISVDPTDGSCWVAGQSYPYRGVVKLDAAGNELAQALGSTNSISANPVDGSCWVETGNWATKIVLSVLGSWLGWHDSGETDYVWGILEWDASIPDGAEVKLFTQTYEPSSGYLSPWSEPYETSGSIVTSPPGQYILVKCELSSVGSVAPTVFAIRLKPPDSIWQHDIEPIDLLAGATQSYSQQLPSLNETGQYILTADLLCPQTEQVIATAYTSFLVTDADVAVVLNTDKDIYKPNEPIQRNS
jgi:DNA-binding beta-propeller fold protein YncE